MDVVFPKHKSTLMYMVLDTNLWTAPISAPAEPAETAPAAATEPSTAQSSSAEPAQPAAAASCRQLFLLHRQNTHRLYQWGCHWCNLVSFAKLGEHAGFSNKLHELCAKLLELLFDCLWLRLWTHPVGAEFRHSILQLYQYNCCIRAGVEFWYCRCRQRSSRWVPHVHVVHQPGVPAVATAAVASTAQPAAIATSTSTSEPAASASVAAFTFNGRMCKHVSSGEI
jgi:hypothetical protein